MSSRNRLQTDPIDVVISWNIKRWVSTHKISDSSRDRLMEKASYLSGARMKHVGLFPTVRGILQDLRHVLAFPAWKTRIPHEHVDCGRRLTRSPQIYCGGEGHALFHPFIGGSGIYYVMIPCLPG
jgi:hypothetical protein